MPGTGEGGAAVTPKQPNSGEQIPLDREHHEAQALNRVAGLVEALWRVGNEATNNGEMLKAREKQLEQEREQHAAELQAKDAEIAQLNLDLAQLKGQRP